MNAKTGKQVDFKVIVFDKEKIMKPLNCCDYILETMIGKKECSDEEFSNEMNTFIQSMDDLIEYGEEVMKKVIRELKNSNASPDILLN